jgi:hypothetical protein
MLSEAKHLWFISDRRINQIDPRFFASLRMTLGDAYDATRWG